MGAYFPSLNSVDTLTYGLLFFSVEGVVEDTPTDCLRPSSATSDEHQSEIDTDVEHGTPCMPNEPDTGVESASPTQTEALRSVDDDLVGKPDLPIDLGGQQKHMPKTRSSRRKSDEEQQKVEMSPAGAQIMEVDEAPERRTGGIRRSLDSREDVAEALVMDVENTGPEGPKKKVKKLQSLAPATKGKKKAVKR